MLVFAVYEFVAFLYSIVGYIDIGLRGLPQVTRAFSIPVTFRFYVGGVMMT